MKERVEDLGKPAILISQLREHKLFDFWNGRKKDFPDWVAESFSKAEDERSLEIAYDLLHDIACGIVDVEEKLTECLIIAEGTYDDLP